MYKWLYDQFAHWFHDNRGQVWFYSDPHFADDEMKYLRTNYIGDDEQIQRINSKVGKWDTLVILGDVGDTEFVKKLHGYKVLVMGNHDSGASNYVRQRYTVDPHGGYNDVTDINVANITQWDDGFHRDWYFDNHLFDEVYEGPLFISDKLLLSHEPIDFPYALNIHGHDHSSWHPDDPLHLNVCAEHIDYTPIPLKSIATSGRLKRIPTIHRDTIDRATERKAARHAQQ